MRNEEQAARDAQDVDPVGEVEVRAQIEHTGSPSFFRTPVLPGCPDPGRYISGLIEIPQEGRQAPRFSGSTDTDPQEPGCQAPAQQ
jgi:hypothetical protein